MSLLPCTGALGTWLGQKSVWGLRWGEDKGTEDDAVIQVGRAWGCNLCAGMCSIPKSYETEWTNSMWTKKCQRVLYRFRVVGRAELCIRDRRRCDIWEQMKGQSISQCLDHTDEGKPVERKSVVSSDRQFRQLNRDEERQKLVRREDIIQAGEGEAGRSELS